MIDWLAAFEALPYGAFRATWDGRKWEVVKSCHVQGRAWKIFAEESGGADLISANIYRMPTGNAMLRPCEMPARHVMRFILEARADETDLGGPEM